MYITDIISIASGVLSIVLACYAIWFAKKESTQSDQNYNKTKDLLKEIEHKADLIDRGLQFQQNQLTMVVNKLFDLTGKEHSTMAPLTLAEIDEIIEGKSAEANQRLKDMEEMVGKLPRIRYGTKLPTDINEGDVFLLIESDDGN